MTEARSAATQNGLYAALAKLQAELPFVGKNKTGKIPGKDGKQGYSYDYADLADVTAALAPLLGRLGLAFTSKPTINGGGQFVLAYKLVHVSGETDEGEYLLPSPERVSPQQLGSFITYARRYSLCAVTGLAPGGDDDDGQSAQGAGTTEEDWRSQPAVQPREEARPPEHSEDLDDGDWGAWTDVIKDITTPEEADQADSDLREVFKTGAMGPTKAGNIRAAIKARAAELAGGTRSPNGKHREEVSA